KNVFFCVAKTQIDDPDGRPRLILLGTDPVKLSFAKVRTISKGAGRLTAAVECQNILGEHPEWSSGPRGLRLPVWQDTAGDLSSKIDHITPPVDVIFCTSGGTARITEIGCPCATRI
ncbi:hypothetical protein B0H14DRAFT_2389911, partial [Mycena olivaceomarginata]